MENTSKLKFLFLTIITLTYSCNSRLTNPKERNIISFKDNIDSVVKVIESMNNILDGSMVNNYFYYAIDKDVLYLKHPNDELQKVGTIPDTDLSCDTVLSFIDSLQRLNFLKYAFILNNNFLSRCDKQNFNYIYFYRPNIYMADKQEDMMRYIVLPKNINDIDFNKYKIIDNTNSLYLLVNRNAEIWEK